MLLLGEVHGVGSAACDSWGFAAFVCLEHTNVKGLIAGRSLLYPADDVAAAVDTAVSPL